MGGIYVADAPPAAPAASVYCNLFEQVSAKKLMFFTLSEALHPRESVKNTVFCLVLRTMPKTELRWGSV